MVQSESNEQLAKSSFLYGGNASYVESLLAKYVEDPTQLDKTWQDYFKNLKEDKKSVISDARGATWGRSDWPIAANGELVSALDGDWSPIENDVSEKLISKAHSNGVELTQEQVHKATRDSVRSIMMIRAYRMRGHLHANLDPLNIAVKQDHEELKPATFGFTEADYDRKIFIDNVLGLEFATIREMSTLR